MIAAIVDSRLHQARDGDDHTNWNPQIASFSRIMWRCKVIKSKQDVVFPDYTDRRRVGP